VSAQIGEVMLSGETAYPPLGRAHLVGTSYRQILVTVGIRRQRFEHLN
jgi:hypothetical protein